MTLDYLQSHPIVACIASVYSTSMALINPKEVLLQASAWGGVIVIMLTIYAKWLEIKKHKRDLDKK